LYILTNPITADTTIAASAHCNQGEDKEIRRHQKYHKLVRNSKTRSCNFDNLKTP
jgi:hypothetical protein